MSDHLPECPCANTSAHPDGCLCCEVSSPCICDRLRACEQRTEEAMDRAWTHTLRIKQAEAYANGVAAAREAVAVLIQEERSSGLVSISRADALAAIDALKEKP